MGKKQPLLIILAFVVLLVTLIAHQFSARRYQKLAEARMKSDEYLNELMELWICVTEAETGYRGYILANNVWYKETYDNAIRRFPKIVDRLRVIYESKDVEEIIKYGKARLDILENGLNLYTHGNKSAALESFKTGEGKKLMDVFRYEIVRLKGEINRQEQELNADFNIASFVIYNVMGFMHLLAIILVAISIVPQNEVTNKELK